MTFTSQTRCWRGAPARRCAACCRLSSFQHRLAYVARNSGSFGEHNVIRPPSPHSKYTLNYLLVHLRHSHIRGIGRVSYFSLFNSSSLIDHDEDSISVSVHIEEGSRMWYRDMLLLADEGGVPGLLGGGVKASKADCVVAFGPALPGRRYTFRGRGSVEYESYTLELLERT